MADKLTNESANKEHNSKSRKEAIRNAVTEMLKLDDEIGDKMAKHIEPLRAAKRDIKKRLRNDYDITATQFQARYQVAKLEHRAHTNDDEITLDVIAELFEALPMGETVDMLDALDKAAE